MNDGFKGYHPVTNFLYLFTIIVLGMSIRHPVYQLISILGGISFLYLLRKDLRLLKYSLPVFLFTAILNPIFVKEGDTVVDFLSFSFTVEALASGLSAGLMLINILVWFGCFQEIMDSDKLMRVFGRVLPSISMMVIIALRFIPMYKRGLEGVNEGQKGIGRDYETGDKKERRDNAVKILSIYTSRALEDGIITADSMTARGYGLEGRTFFSIYRYRKKDYIFLGAYLILLLLIIMAIIVGYGAFKFYPRLSNPLARLGQLVFYLISLIFTSLPFVTSLR